MSTLIFLNRKPGHSRLAHLLLASNLALSFWEATHLHAIMTIVNSLSSTVLLGLTWACYRDEVGTIFPSILRLGIEKITLTTQGRHKKIPFIPIILGATATLIVTGVLTNADPLFSEKIKFIADLFNQEFWQRLSATIGISIPLIPALYIYFRKVKLDKKLEVTIHDLRLLLASSASWASLFLSGILGFFIYTSLSYLTSKLDPHLPGFTYSSYVTQGFSELIIASVLTFIIAQLANNFFSKLLSTLTLGVVALNLYKLHLYVSENGFTQTRVLGVWFLLWLAIILFSQLIIKRQVYYFGLACSIILLFLANIIDTDGLIMSSYPPKVNGAVDNYYMIQNFGLKTKPLWPKLLSKNNTIINNYLLLDPKNLSFDQYYAAHWAINENNAIQYKIVELLKKYGSPTELSLVTNFDYANTPQQEAANKKLLTGQSLNQHERQLLWLPPNSWPYQNIQEKSFYDPSLNTIYKNIVDLNSKLEEFEKNIPQQISSDFGQKVWDRKTY